MAIATYDPRLVTVTFNGLVISGFGTDSIIKVARAEDSWFYKPSASGSGARSRNPNRQGAIEITLHNKSPSMAVLSAILVADELRGEGVGEFLVKDGSTSTSLCQARNAWILKPADWERQKEVGETVWTMSTDEVLIFHDGLLNA